ncbi:MAG TPA: hypothetical protein VL359_15035 [bacterium]|nr:hypothetical protein [bacterium]
MPLSPRNLDEIARCLAHLKVHQARPTNLYRPDVLSVDDALQRLLWAVAESVVEVGRATGDAAGDTHI